MKIEMALAAVHMSAALKYRRGWAKNNVGVEIIKSFNKNKGGKASQRYRLYLPINSAAHRRVKVPQDIKRAVDQAGYVISDYIAGLATQKDGKRVMKIGKLIKDERLRAKFANDEQRQSHKNEYTCVISCHPYDIIGMSTGRTWDQFSCMRLGAGNKLNPQSNNGEDGAYAETLTNDIKAGTLVAYAVKNSDMDIKNPDARLLIKPYLSARQDQVLFRVETKLYGNHVTGFRETISAFLRKVNANVGAGKYWLANGLYNDGAGAAAQHMGELAYADLTDPEKLKAWTNVAGTEDYVDKFSDSETPESTIHAILQTSQVLYRDYVFNEAIKPLLNPDVDMELAQERFVILLKRVLAEDEHEDMLNVLMNTYMNLYTFHGVPQEARDILRPMMWYDQDHKESHAWRCWVYKFNPTLLMAKDGSVDPNLDRYIRLGDEYPWIEAAILKADKKTKLYQLGLLESFVRFASARMKGLKSTMGWQSVDPSRTPSDNFVRHELMDVIKRQHWTDGQILYALAANGSDWFNADNAHLVQLSNLDGVTIEDIFNNPYIHWVYGVGVENTPNDISIADNFAQIVERACAKDPEGVKREEQRLYEVSELLGEHDYNIKRGIEKAIERVIYG